MDPESKCLADAFTKAMDNEQLYPVKCCDQILLIDDYQEYIPDLIPFELYMAFKEKELEYATQAKYRVYCGNTGCAQFLHRQNYSTSDTVSYAKCDRCDKHTCTKCKNLLHEQKREDNELGPALAAHNCDITESEKQFRDAAKEHGYQVCDGCGGTVELKEACNHMTCTCGYSFCYICGKAWEGVHACPLYGPVAYDEEGYNQEGFHRDTGLNRAGQTRQQVEADPNDDEDDNNNDDEFDGDPLAIFHQGDLEALGIDAEARRMMLNLPEDELEETLQQIQIEAMDRGMVLRRAGEESDDEPGAEEDDAAEDQGSNNGDEDPTGIEVEEGNAQANEEGQETRGDTEVLEERLRDSILVESVVRGEGGENKDSLKDFQWENDRESIGNHDDNGEPAPGPTRPNS